MEGDQMEGVMAKLKKSDGSFTQGGTDGRSVAYFGSIIGKDDWIMNACADPNNRHLFYIVGATKGNINQSVAIQDTSTHAFVAKIDLKTLTPSWSTQYPVMHHSSSNKAAATSAFGCDVIPGNELMYVAGTVKNGATIDFPGTSSAGQDDICIAQDGTLQWIEQVGSNGNNHVAYSGGVATDANKNAVVYEDTTGDFFRS
jgi:hypothetical protein